MNDDFLKKVYEIECEMYDESKKEDTECKHEVIDECGQLICLKCGCITGVVTDGNIDYDCQRVYYTKRVYKSFQYLRKVIRKLSGYFYSEKREVNIKDMPSNIKKIRKYLQQNKLHKLNDIYYWRIKNDVNVEISFNEQCEMVNEYKKMKTKISTKDYLHHYFKDKEKYQDLMPLITKKKICST